MKKSLKCFTYLKESFYNTCLLCSKKEATPYDVKTKYDPEMHDFFRLMPLCGTCKQKVKDQGLSKLSDTHPKIERWLLSRFWKKTGNRWVFDETKKDLCP